MLFLPNTIKGMEEGWRGGGVEGWRGGGVGEGPVRFTVQTFTPSD